MVVILLAQVLAYIVGSGIVSTHHAEAVFWRMRLDFIVVEIDTIASNTPLCFFKIFAEDENKGREAWDYVLSWFQEKNLRINSIGFWKYAVLRLIAATVIIPVWLVTGLACAGVLWPPQIREYVFVQPCQSMTECSLSEEYSSAPDTRAPGLVNTNEIEKQVEELKTEMEGLKNSVDTILQLMLQQQQAQSSK